MRDPEYITVNFQRKKTPIYQGKHRYYVTVEQVGYALIVERKDGTEDAYACGTLSVALDSIEALERGEEI